MEHDSGLYRRIGIRSAVIVCAVVLVLTVGVWLFWLLLPFFLAYFFSWILNPVVSAINRKTRLPRRLIALVLVALAFLAVSALLIYLIFLAVSEVADLANSWQELMGSAESFVSDLRTRFVLPFDSALLRGNIDSLLEAARTTLSGLLAPLSSKLIDLAADAARMAPTALLFVIALVMGCYFILSDFDGMHEKLRSALQAEGFRPVLRVLYVLRHAFGGYLMASFALAVMVSLIDLAGLLLLRVEYAVLLALLMGVLDFLPYVGSGAILIPWGIGCFYVGDWLRGLCLLALYAVVFFARNVAGRRIMGTKFRHSPFLGMVCAFIGWKLWGVPGLILGPVLCMIGINVWSSGILDRTVADFKLLYADLYARLSGRGAEETPPE